MSSTYTQYLAFTMQINGTKINLNIEYLIKLWHNKPVLLLL
ncbi:hypothetical protein LDG_6743 [Legionella drancourtii LLAP12]|uniref:Uncharacterized protein n=1 Tax=Legionella drancourtii LLAP12 TaxID=658187 RepID=G9ENC1_9GAMM|nr:hypothetical protein LDG_6743 [Legionella drancourtii LLAP12]